VGDGAAAEQTSPSHTELDNMSASGAAPSRKPGRKYSALFTLSYSSATGWS
jgi:hypothetical protein